MHMIVIYPNALERPDVFAFSGFQKSHDADSPFKIRIRFRRQLLKQRQRPRIAGTPVREELREVFEATLVTFVPFPTIKIITQTLQSNSILQLLVKM